ncbi:hypothetical protein [Trinickia acidisoli]|uniref:hypothetical protein n=1 Tax=Trinickia acidisoli TaxID=2767482 RepID=UPI001A8DA1CC|nr:hypothetical protein [Trinickia acidisoli]
MLSASALLGTRMYETSRTYSKLDTDDLAKNATFSASSCPVGLTSLCHDLAAAATQAQQ